MRLNCSYRRMSEQICLDKKVNNNVGMISRINCEINVFCSVVCLNQFTHISTDIDYENQYYRSLAWALKCRAKSRKS